MSQACGAYPALAALAGDRAAVHRHLRTLMNQILTRDLEALMCDIELPHDKKAKKQCHLERRLALWRSTRPRASLTCILDEAMSPLNREASAQLLAAHWGNAFRGGQAQADALEQVCRHVPRRPDALPDP